jgi:C-terminal peptidase prc
LLALTLACQALTDAWQAGTTPNAPTLPPSASPTRSATPWPTPSLSPTTTWTPSPAPTLFATATPTLAITPSPRQLEIFEELWQIISEDYLYPDFNGLDWDAIHIEYRQRIERGLTDDHFYLAMDEMISRLGDDHSAFLSPQEVLEEDSQYAGNNDYVGVGVLVTAIPERGRAAILVAFPGSPAEQAGLQPHDSILAVDGEPILDENGFLRDIVVGLAGTPVTLTVQTPGQEPRELTLVRRQIGGPVPTPYQVLTTSTGRRVGYLLLVTFNDITIDDQIEAALRDMAQAGPLDGLILDNRENSGGADTVLRDTLAYFTGGTLGHLVSRSGERPLQVKSVDVGGSHTVPLVVLVGDGTASYGEVFAGILKDQQRAYLIGETTEGNVETLWGYDFDDGSRAWLAHEFFRPYRNPEENWEETGVIPHLTVHTDWDEFTLEVDPAVQAALDYLEGKDVSLLEFSYRYMNSQRIGDYGLQLYSGYGKLPGGSGNGFAG